MTDRLPPDRIARAMTVRSDGLLPWPDPVTCGPGSGFALFGVDGRLISASPLYWHLSGVRPEDCPAGSDWRALASTLYRECGLPRTEATIRAEAMLEMLRSVGGCAEDAPGGPVAVCTIHRQVQRDGSGIEVIAPTEPDAPALRSPATLGAELKEAERDVQDLIGFVLKDLHGPTCEIDRFVSQIVGAQALDDETQKSFVVIKQRTDLMRLKTSRLLEHIEILEGASPFEVVDMTVQLEHVLNTMQERLESAMVVVEYGVLPRIEGDPGQIRTVFEALICNAITYRNPDEGATIRILPRDSTKHEACFAVSDYGTGFDRSQTENVFRPFCRLHGSKTHAGAGLGLTTCKKIIQRHGGVITADSAEGEGTTITITLPLSQNMIPS